MLVYWRVFTIFSDTYGLGFGLSWTKGGSVDFRFGVWNEEGYETSYNYKEFRNLLKTLEELGKEVNLQGKEVFICTDNMVLESISTVGSSSLEVLFDLVVWLYCLSMRYKCNVRFIHVTETRMII